MANKDRTSLVSALLLRVTFAFGFGVALLAATNGTTSASISTETTENSTVPASNVIPLANKPFLVESGKTVAANPINQTHIQIRLAGNEALSPTNSTESDIQVAALKTHRGTNYLAK
ncbi:MAG TPA: hypothetical protein VE264_00365 [Nitrososphaera sp.]|nr:hypothetical protein [Nitrososphaera sp.]